ncbi:MAG: hypothetical protein KIS62_18015 [Ramlibacter sp.]|nr:hypothetical protein [Ramlibacter sp.]MCW5651646.1 hypothetical protein [Ramlibacter sp.]
MVEFLRSLGLQVRRDELGDDCFLPGLALEAGTLVVDESRLKYPGDLLHEAGHLAVLTTAERARVDGTLAAEGGEEMGAIAWSYAAARHLGLDLAVLFHPQGYRDGADALLENFAQGHYVGVPYLQWLGLTLEPGPAAQQGCAPYPHMLRWLRE